MIKKISFPLSLVKSNLCKTSVSYKPTAKIHFSKGNDKTHTPSIDLPAGIFCNRKSACWQSGRCYACHLRNCAQQNYLDNAKLALDDMQKYFTYIKNFVASMKSKYFRYHVSGEIINNKYLENMIAIAKDFKKVMFWTYTKKYSLVNDYVEKNGSLPKNLIIIFSADENLTLDNPYHLPIFSQYYKGNEKSAINYAKSKNLKAYFCCGDCKKCQENKTCCPSGKKNTVIFCHIHGSKYNTYNTAVTKKGLSAIKATSKIYKEYSNNPKFVNGVLKF